MNVLRAPYDGVMNRLVRVTTPEPDEVARSLPAVTAEEWNALPSGYGTALLEQYKIYVEMADRISARRSLTNTFFLTLNSAVFTIFGVLWKDRPVGSPWWLAFPLIALLGQCVAWYWLLRSYRQLNSAKYTVIGAIEAKLPISPYWSAEWTALREGRDPRRYLPLTHLEQWVPVLFGLTYLAAFVAALIA